MLRTLRFAGYVLAGLVVAVGLAYALAQVALDELEQPARAGAAPAVAGGALAAAADADGRMVLWHGPWRQASADAHSAAIATADMLPQAEALLTSANDGSIRLMRVGATGTLHAVSSPRLRSVLHDRLWRPYGSPVAHNALWLVSQLVPLPVPETRRGRRGRIFRDDCSGCPEMVEIEPGMAFTGAPLLWGLWGRGRSGDDGWRRIVTVGQAFAVGRVPLTPSELKDCVEAGGCSARPNTAPDPRLSALVREQQDLAAEWQKRDRLRTDIASRPPDKRDLAAEAVNAARLAAIDTALKEIAKRFSVEFPAYSDIQEHAAIEAEKIYKVGLTVSWQDAKAYVAWLGKKTGERYRLLTETEWEYVARQGTPNAFGVQGMTAEWEWVEDCLRDTATPAAGEKPEDCARRRIKGGWWLDLPEGVRASGQAALPPTAGDGVGNRGWRTWSGFARGGVVFRVARALTP